MSDEAPAPMTAGQKWAALIRQGATDPDIVIAAINALTCERRSNRGGVMVACAYLLAQSIVAGGHDNAKEIRAGVLALIDGYATEVAAGAA